MWRLCEAGALDNRHCASVGACEGVMPHKSTPQPPEGYSPELARATGRLAGKKRGEGGKGVAQGMHCPSKISPINFYNWLDNKASVLL